MSRRLGHTGWYMDCAGCGDCCDPVWLPYSKEMLTTTVAMNSDGDAHDLGEDATFVLAHMTPMDPQPAQPSGETGSGIAWSCDAWDPSTRQSTAHDDRPPMCRAYPWYGQPAADTVAALLPRCSHRWDVAPAERGPLSGRLLPLWPVEAA